MGANKSRANNPEAAIAAHGDPSSMTEPSDIRTMSAAFSSRVQDAPAQPREVSPTHDDTLSPPPIDLPYEYT